MARTPARFFDDACLAHGQLRLLRTCPQRFTEAERELILKEADDALGEMIRMRNAIIAIATLDQRPDGEVQALAEAYAA